MLLVIILILSTRATVESVRLQGQITFVAPTRARFSQIAGEIIVNSDNTLNVGENSPKYWYKLPKEYKIPLDNSPSNTSSSDNANNQSISIDELDDLGISIKTSCVDLDNKNSIVKSTPPSSSESHPLADTKLTSQLSNSNLVEDLYYTDIVLSTKENKSPAIDPLALYENDLLASTISADDDKDSIQEALNEANRVIDQSQPIDITEYSKSYTDSTFPKIDKLPPKNLVTGEYLIDRHLIHKVAALRSCLEILEKGVEKNKVNSSLNGLFSNNSDTKTKRTGENPLADIFCCFNDPQMKLFKQLVLDEGLFEEVTGRAMAIYERAGDTKSLERVTWIATQIGPWISQLRKDSANEKLSILISSALKAIKDDVSKNDNNRFSNILWNYCERGLLDRYLVKRCEELIAEARKKYRIDEQVPSVSEVFLTFVKNQIIAQMITNLNGTDLYIKTLIECINGNKEDWRKIINNNIKSMEDIQEFIGWLNVGADYLSRSENPGKVVSAEVLLEIIDELGDGVEN